jgi:hypothetical protein
MGMNLNPLAKVFDELFESKLRSGVAHHIAYEQAENDFEQKFNHRKYSSSESYRKCRSKRIKKRK